MMHKSGLNYYLSIGLVLIATIGLCHARSGLYSEESPSSIRIEQCHQGCIKKVIHSTNKKKHTHRNMLAVRQIRDKLKILIPKKKIQRVRCNTELRMQFFGDNTHTFFRCHRHHGIYF